MLKFRNQKGFTLIELLVTVAIIGIIGVSLLGLLTVSMQNNVHSKSKTSTGVVAQSFMEFYKKYTAQTLMAGKSQGETIYLYILYKAGDSIPDNPLIYSSDLNTFDEVLSELGNPDLDTFDFVIKAALTKDINLIQINISVWDKVYKDSSKVNLISLRSY